MPHHWRPRFMRWTLFSKCKQRTLLDSRWPEGFVPKCFMSKRYICTLITMLFPATSTRLLNVTQSMAYAKRYTVTQPSTPFVATRTTLLKEWNRTWNNKRCIKSNRSHSNSNKVNQNCVLSKYVYIKRFINVAIACKNVNL